MKYNQRLIMPITNFVISVDDEGRGTFVPSADGVEIYDLPGLIVDHQALAAEEKTRLLELLEEINLRVKQMECDEILKACGGAVEEQAAAEAAVETEAETGGEDKAGDDSLESQLAALSATTLVTEGGPVIDQYNSWLLGIAAVTISLIVVSMDTLAPVFTMSGIGYAVYALIGSALFGMLAKFSGIAYRAAVALNKRLEQVLGRQLSADKAALDTDRIVSQVVSAWPAPFRWLYRLRYGNKDKARQRIVEQYSWKKALGSLYWQYFWVIVQSLAFAVFAVLAVLSIK